MIEIIEALIKEIHRMELLVGYLEQTGLYRRAAYRKMEIERLRNILNLVREKRHEK